MPRALPLSALALSMAATLLVGGCLDAGQGLDRAELSSSDDGVFILIRVLDTEFFPVHEASVAAQPGDLEAVTDANGTARLGPLEPPIRLDVRAEKRGYAAAEIDVEVPDAEVEPVTLVLEPVGLDVPYHSTVNHVAYIDCAWAASIGTLPCNVVDRQLGTNLTMDRSQWFFEIPAPHLASLLQESMWNPNPVGQDMRFLLFHPDLVTGSAVGGETYLDGRGGSPFRTMMVPGQPADRADVPFNGNESFEYQALYRPWYTNSTLGIFAIYVDHRVDNWYTFFYHRPGTLDFTALPDV